MSFQFANPARALSPVDELGHLRKQIAHLKAREAELRAVLLSDPRACAGERFHATIRIHEQRVLRRDRLPDTVLNDATLWETRKSRHVIVDELPVETARSQAALELQSNADDDDFAVIEPF
ncbi:hypothetical protein [Rhodalgimonas zhirmunskyi]|uniref:Uncharacterized protein n=1 Tax=Rhodalgimonas zhirmunskyi TaxID=2964767 RepID=A0AAJ1UBE9_9RHOB|nr:hypothetical protein [Rhodoalgimonas zhirmunskyi]MDQ2094723.1 hypothetical protein [Rhodoalgimonas zhirmunskyi]